MTKKFTAIINNGVEIFHQHEKYCTDLEGRFNRIHFYAGDDVEELKKEIHDKLNKLFPDEEEQTDERVASQPAAK